MQAVLAIDGGGTRTRCQAIDAAGRVLGAGEGGPSNHLLVPAAAVAESLTAAMSEALAQAQLTPAAVACVAAGLAGVDGEGAGADAAARIFHSIGYRQLSLHGDMVIAHRGALTGAPGVMALSGTGAVYLAVDEQGRAYQADGWGPLYGDEGSAYWIACRALEAAAHDYDRRGPATALTAAFCRALSISRFSESVPPLYAQGRTTRDTAALSRVVGEVAAAGDAVAAEVLRRAGEVLAGHAAALARIPGVPHRFSWQGAVLRNCAPVHGAFRARLRELLPDAEIVPPAHEPIWGAYLLGCRRLDWNPL
jgi:glucosamine kinase